MRVGRISNVAVLLGASGVVAENAGVSPIAKVVELLTKMYKTGSAESDAEEVKASKFAEQCNQDITYLSEDVQTAQDGIDDQDSVIAKSVADIANLDDEIATLDEATSNDTFDLKNAQDIRNAEKKTFEATHRDYTESLSALSRAIQLLESKSVTAEATVQLQTSLEQFDQTPLSALASVSSFLQVAASAPPQGTTTSYNSRMGGVIAMLTDLNDKFSAEMDALVKTEKGRVQAFQMLKAALLQKMKLDKATKDRKNKRKGEVATTKGQAEEEKVGFQKDLKNSKKNLGETKVYCKVNNGLYAKQNAMRKGEVMALKQAIDILNKQALVQETAVASFLQLSASSEDINRSSKVVALLVAKSKQYKSAQLSALAMRIQAGPFDKVLEMIRNLVSKLQAEAVSEAERHGECQAMKAEQKLDVEDKTEQKEDLANQKASLESRVAQLSEEIATLNSELSILTQDKGEATKQRAADKAENAKQVKEAKEGQQALNDAMQVLQSFYAGSQAHAAENENLAEDNETTLDTPVYGGSGSAGSVIEMMQQIADDFARQEAESTAAENQQASEYKALMNSNEVDVASKTTARDFKKKQLAESKKQLSMVSSELKNASSALDSALKQQEATKKQCDGRMSFEERMEQRDYEIQSLKEALEVLKNYS